MLHLGGPRWPKMLMVIKVPDLQQGHFLSLLATLTAGGMWRSDA